MNTTFKTLIGVVAGVGIGLAAATVAAQGWGGGYGNCPWQGQGAAAQTQPGGGGGYGPGHCRMGRGMGPGMGRGRGMGGGNPEARVDQRLDGLRNGIGITTEQEPAWEAFADQMRAQASAHSANRAAMRAMRQSPDTTALQRMEQREAFMAQRHESIKQTHAAFRTLYEQLTPEQRLVADRAPIGGMGRGMGRGMGPGMGMGPR